jgi:hypothetical protein
MNVFLNGSAELKKFVIVKRPVCELAYWTSPGTGNSRSFSRSGSTIKSGKKYSSVSTDLTQLRDYWYTSRDV